MYQENIRKSREEIQYIIVEKQNILKEIQNICNHPNVSKEYKANTGNYDSSADRYWINFHCPDCDKRWQEDQ
jgi:hypothetical protein